MRKILLLIFILCFFSLNVEAKTFKVISLKTFSTEMPSPTFAVQTIQKEILTSNFVLPKGTIIFGIVLKVNSPTIGKRNGTFEFIPTETIYKGVATKINHPTMVAEVVGYNSIGKRQIAFDTAKKTANFFLRGAISVFEFADGAINAQDGQRIRTGVKKAYNDSFLSYIEPGKELHVRRGDIIILKIKTTR